MGYIHTYPARPLHPGFQNTGLAIARTVLKIAENLAFKGKLVWFGLDWFSLVFCSMARWTMSGEFVCKI